MFGGWSEAAYTNLIPPAPKAPPCEGFVCSFLLVSCYALRYTQRVIRSFSDKRAAEIFSNRVPKGFPTDILATARRKLAMLDAAETLNDLRSPPGNRLEALQGNRAGQHSIRVNNQWRVCFVWYDDGPHEVEIVDYHG